MSNGNILKWSCTKVAEGDKRIINTNELVARRIEEFEEKMKEMERTGFVSGLSAQVVEVDEELLAKETEEAEGEPLGETQGYVHSYATQEAENILERARQKAQQIELDAQIQAQQEKTKVFEEAKQQGFQEGMVKAQKEILKAKQQFEEQKKKLEEEYEQKICQLEPMFVDTITGIYEHIFHVELESYREILTYLISSAMRKIEENKSFMIHVSKEDYPYVSMQKKQLSAGAVSANCTLEIVEDLTLGHNECMIETEGGIFDCGLGTQLSELGQKLRLLSYEKVSD